MLLHCYNFYSIMQMTFVYMNEIKLFALFRVMTVPTLSPFIYIAEINSYGKFWYFQYLEFSPAFSVLLLISEMVFF